VMVEFEAEPAAAVRRPTPCRLAEIVPEARVIVAEDADTAARCCAGFRMGYRRDSFWRTGALARRKRALAGGNRRRIE
jgi:hypothetical protein